MSAVAAYTTGPWNGCQNGKCSCGYVFGDGGRAYVAKALSLDDDVDPVAAEPFRRANAHMIAAAPEMFEALSRCEQMVSTDNGPPNWDWIRSVLAKARGESQ